MNHNLLQEVFIIKQEMSYISIKFNFLYFMKRAKNLIRTFPIIFNLFNFLWLQLTYLRNGFVQRNIKFK